MMTDELFQACEFAKVAADMSIPAEPMPTPEPGSEAVDGMVNASMMDPNSVGAGTYAGAVDQAALAQAKARAAAAAEAAQKTAAIEEAFEMGYYDAYAEYDEMNKIASVEDAYVMGYEAAIAELEKFAGVKETASEYFGKGKEKVTDAAGRVANAGRSLASRAGVAGRAAIEYAKANPKQMAGAGAALAGLAGAGVAGKRMLDARRKAKMMRRAGIGGAALAGLAGLGYAAHKARD